MNALYASNIFSQFVACLLDFLEVSAPKKLSIFYFLNVFIFSITASGFGVVLPIPSPHLRDMVQLCPFALPRTLAWKLTPGHKLGQP